MSDAPAHRASDAEREAVAERLRRAGAEGRLDPDELDERLERALTARTRAELDALVADLPDAPARPRRADVPGGLHSPVLAQRLASWAVINAICMAIWALAGADGSFWPKWVLLGTTIAVVAPFAFGHHGKRSWHGGLHGPHGTPPHVPRAPLPPQPPMPPHPPAPPHEPRTRRSASGGEEPRR